MSGLFGTRASVLSDLNLVFQIVFLLILLAGYFSGKKKTSESLKRHGRFMTILVALNALSIVLVMGPIFFLNLSVVAAEVSAIGFPLTLIHHLIGLSAEILGAVLVFKKFGNVRAWMRTAFAFWFIAVVFGISVYVMYYVA